MAAFKRLLNYMRPYLAQMVAATVMLTIAGAIMSVVVATGKPLMYEVLQVKPAEPATVETEEPDFFEGLIDDAMVWLHIDELSRWLSHRAFFKVPVLIVVIFLIRAILLYFGQYLTTKVGSSVIRDLRAELYENLVEQSLSFFKDNPTGLVLSRVLNDVQRIQRLSTAILADLVRIAATVPFMLAVVLIHDWRISVFTLVVLPFFAYPIARLGSRLRKASHRAQETTADASNLLNETVVGIKIIQSFLMEKVSIGRFRNSVDQILRADLQAGRAAALSGPIMEVVGAIAGATLFYIAGRAIAGGSLDPGDFVVVVAGLAFLFTSVRRVTRYNVEIQQAVAAAVRVFEMIDWEQEIQESPTAETLPPFEREISFERLRFAYPDGDTVLHDIDLRIASGETVALVGPSGAGKTTLANIVPRFLDPTGGRVAVDGHDLRGVTLRSLRGQIGMVTQETVLFDDTVRRNITCGRDDVADDQVIAVATAAHAHDFISELPDGYDTRLGELGSRLSMGQRQRIAVARALYKNPPILILDEATSALDAESEDLVQRALSTLLEGRSSLVIAHRLSTVRQADRILVLENGRIAEEGPHEELLAAGGVYARLHALQFKQ